MSTTQSAKKDGNKRRWFLNLLMGTAGGGFLSSVFYPISKYLIPPKVAEAVPSTVEVALENEIAPNSGKIVRFGRKPVILLRTKNGELRAFSAICTHLECIVQYRSDLEHIWCACHNGHYDLKGINIAGPPPRPLQPYQVNVKEGKILISRLA